MSDLKNPECTLCNKTFPILEVLNDHMKLIHHESSSIRLVRLEETIKTALEESSVRRDDIKDNKSLDCTECGICFSNGEEKINHENKHHTQKKNEYICDLCDRIFPNRVERSNHMLFVHIQKSKNFKCDYSSNCGEVFNGLKQLCLLNVNRECIFSISQVKNTLKKSKKANNNCMKYPKPKIV